MTNDERKKTFRKFSVEFPQEMFAQIEARAKALHINKSQLIRDAVRVYLAR